MLTCRMVTQCTQVFIGIPRPASTSLEGQCRDAGTSWYSPALLMDSVLGLPRKDCSGLCPLAHKHSEHWMLLRV